MSTFGPQFEDCLGQPKHSLSIQRLATSCGHHRGQQRTWVPAAYRKVQVQSSDMLETFSGKEALQITPNPGILVQPLQRIGIPLPPTSQI